MSHWTIVRAAQSDYRGWYLVDLECGDAQASAFVGVMNRNRRGAAHEPWDPQVTVLDCTDESAREWLEAHEHEYYVAEQCVRRAA